MADHTLDDGKIVEVLHTSDKNGDQVVSITVLNDELLHIAGPVELQSWECTPERIRDIIPDGNCVPFSHILNISEDCKFKLIRSPSKT